MARNEQFVGKIYTHKTLGKVSIESTVPKSRTKVVATCLERGVGWNEIKQSYTGVRNSVGWYRGENRDFGTKHEVHIDDLKK